MNKENPLVTIIVRTKDRPKLLKRALKSIADQTYKPIEIILVNDGGCNLDPEELEAILGEVSINYIYLEKNMGRAYAGNVGIKNAQGSYIGFLDDDDEFYPEHVSVLINYLLESDLEIAYTDSLMVYQAYDPHTKEISAVDKKLVYSSDFDYDIIVFENYIPLMCLLFRKEVLLNSEGFDTGLELYEDWELLIRLGEKYPFKHIRKTTANYYQWSSELQISHMNQDIFSIRDSYLRIVRKHIKKFTPERIHKYRSNKYISIENFKTIISDKDIQLGQLGLQVANLETGLKDNDVHINDLNMRINDLASLLSEKEAILEKIYQSRGWKVLSIYYKLKGKILC